jgi:four helix bundle protein
VIAKSKSEIKEEQVATIRHFRELQVYRLGMSTSIQIFKMSKGFPREELFSLTDQIRRSTRSVCSNTAEAWRKRRYPNAFVSKLSDAESEAAETQVWLETAFECNYIDKKVFEEFDGIYEHILGMLVKMIDHPEQWIIRSSASKR